MSLQHQLAEAAAFIKNKSGCFPIKGLVILGSGLGDFANSLDKALFLPYKDIPHFQSSTVQGHAGQLVLGEIAPNLPIACMQGRFHYYEGNDMEQVVFPVRVLRQLGAEFLIVTNAAGGIRPELTPGTLMLIEDHLNLTGTSPLRGPNPDFLGPRFLDMTHTYPAAFRQLASQVAEQNHISLKSGVYAGLSGPTYETPAEVRMLRTLGADAVGMSTVPEVIAAHHAGMKVLGISCITNQAAGLSAQSLNHEEVMDTAQQAKAQFSTLLNGILTRLAQQPNLWSTV